MYKPIALTALLALTGCASVTGSKFQPLMLQTVYDDAPVSGAGCTLSNSAGKWTVKTPGSVRVQKSVSDLLVECQMGEGLSGQLVVPSKANPGNWGNLLLGGPVGLVVDYQTGAGYDYPSVVTVIVNKALDAVVLEPVGNRPAEPIATTPAPEPAAAAAALPPAPAEAPANSAALAPAAPAAAAKTAEPPTPPAEAESNKANTAPAPAPASSAPVYRAKRASSYWE